MGCRERKVQFHSSGCEGTVFWCTAPVMSINTPTKVYRSFGLCRLCWCQRILYHLGWMRPCEKLPINWCRATGFQPLHLLHCSTQSHVMPQYTHQSFCVVIAFLPHLTNMHLALAANSTESHGHIALTVQVKDGNQVGSTLVSHGVGQVAELESPWVAWVMRVFGGEGVLLVVPWFVGKMQKTVVESNGNPGDLMLEWWMNDESCLNYDDYRSTCFWNDGYFVFKWCQIAMFIEKSSNPEHELCFCSILLQHHQSWWPHESKGQFSRGYITLIEW